LLDEQADARKVKQQVPILVILGNPPYNAFAGTATTKEEKESIAPYKEGLIKKWNIKKFNLDELYVRFFRLAERRIAEQTGRGVVCLISGFSYLSDPSFVVMRERLLNEFDQLWVDNLNGDSRETGKRTPEGKPDPSVFSTEYNKAGIRVGTAVSLMVRKKEREEKPLVRSRQFWGTNKRADLLNASDIDDNYEIVLPDKDNRYSLRPIKTLGAYSTWPKLADLANFLSNGLMEKRGGALIDIDRALLEKRISTYFDPKVDWESLKSLKTSLTESATGFDPQKVHDKVLKVEKYDSSRILRYALRPFDTRWCFYSTINPLWNRSRPDLWKQYRDANEFLIIRPAGVSSPEGVPISFTVCLGDNDYLRGHAYYIPIRLKKASNQKKKPKEQAHLISPDVEDKTIANLSKMARSYLASMGINNPDSDTKTANLIWMHAIAIGYSPAYLSENADGIRENWPRIPLPDKKDVLEKSAGLGQNITALLDTEKPVAGITSSPIRLEIQSVGVITREGGGKLQIPKELAITVGWGHVSQSKVVMPGKGKMVKRDYSKEEKQSIIDGSKQLGISAEQAFSLLGESTLDIYINDVVYWKNIPVKVWDYTIGGYQVIKKWLSYREADLLKRPLTPDEAREVMNMARRIAATILLQPALDENYQKCKETAFIDNK
jgi:hypothetical protein